MKSENVLLTESKNIKNNKIFDYDRNTLKYLYFINIIELKEATAPLRIFVNRDIVNYHDHQNVNKALNVSCLC